MSDYQDTILDLMAQNVKLEKKNCGDGIQLAMIDWNQIEKEGYYENIKLVEPEDMSVQSAPFHELQIDYVIGSDLIWQFSMIPGLINTLNKLFTSNKNILFIHSYAERFPDLHLELLREYKKNGFVMEEVYGYGGTRIIDNHDSEKSHLQLLTTEANFRRRELLKVPGYEQLAAGVKKYIDEKIGIEIGLRNQILDFMISEVEK